MYISGVELLYKLLSDQRIDSNCRALKRGQFAFNIRKGELLFSLYLFQNNMAKSQLCLRINKHYWKTKVV